MVVLPESVLRRHERFSLYNSPYPAHESGHAIDLYPGTDAARSPVSGVVQSTRTVRCPRQPHAANEDHLLLVDCGDHVARLLHVDPVVSSGDEVEIGDRIGTLVRSGFFGRWVDNHIHLGFRRPEQNLQRASGSLRIDVDVPVTGIEWDGTGTIVETGATHVRLDSPTDDGGGFTALAGDDGTPLDGGLVHYTGGGALTPVDGDVSLLGTVVGVADGRDISWRDVAARVDGCRASGLSLFVSREPFGAKLVFRDGHDFTVGDEVAVAIEAVSDPVRLG
jgi:hypothetical protein